MSTTQWQPGHVLDVTLDACTTYDSGDVIVLGSLVGVATKDMAASDTEAVQISGVHILPKVTGALTQGEKIYWDVDATNVALGTGGFTSSSGGNIGPSYAAYDAASGDATVKVLINGLPGPYGV